MSRWLKSLLSIFALFAFIWVCGLCWFITLIPSQPATDTIATDAIVVLTGGSGRLEHGFELLAAGRAPKLLITGVEDGLTLPALLRKKEYLPFSEHVPANSVTLGYQARSTVGNAEETAEWAARGHIKSIRLVTANYHIPRSVYELHATMPDVLIIPEPVFPSHFAHNAWWQFSGGIRLVLSEYHKYVTAIIVHTLLEES